MRGRWNSGSRDAPRLLSLDEVERQATEVLAVHLLAHDAEGREATIDGVADDAGTQLDHGLVLVVPDVDAA